MFRACQSTPTLGVRAWRCARAKRGHAIAEPATTLMTSRRRIPAPRAKSTPMVITAYICDRRNGVQGGVCTAAILSGRVICDRCRILALPVYVRFARKADELQCDGELTLCARGGNRCAAPNGHRPLAFFLHPVAAPLTKI